MKNADMPAMPRDCAKSHISTVAKDSIGLTKREHFAGLAMQGICSTIKNPEYDQDLAAKLAVKQADALLAALEDNN